MQPLLFRLLGTQKTGRLFYRDHGNTEDRLFLAATPEEAKTKDRYCKEVAASCSIRSKLESGQVRYIYVRLIKLPTPHAVNGFEMHMYPCVAAKAPNPKEEYEAVFIYEGTQQ